MNEVRCPVCNSVEHQSFWFWEKEDKLMRNWALDTKVHFSICRSCAAIFQNPAIAGSSSDELFAVNWNMEAASPLPSDEPVDWIQQFGNRAKVPGKALEVYAQTKRFEGFLQPLGWEVKTIGIDRLLKKPDKANFSTASETVESDTQDPFAFTSGFDLASPMEEELTDSDQFDLIFCTDVLNRTSRPVDVLHTLRGHVKDDGAILVEQENPFTLPRAGKICLTSEDTCLLSFHSLVYAMYKAGLTNAAAEICGRTRCLATKIDPQPDADAAQLVPPKIWEQILFKFQRNYYWAWVNSYLENYQAQAGVNPAALDTARQSLHQNPFDLHCIRDVCGACLLFVEEVTILRNSLAEDWPMTMHRIYEILKNDYALYDLLRRGPLEGCGTFAHIERFYFNDKLIYLTTPDYFKKYFSEEEARRLCDAMIQAGKVICGQLSSFL